jgi:hydroxylysine kinase
MQTDSTQTTIQKMMTTTPPAFSDANAIKMAACHFGIHAEVQRLVSERDQNFRLDAKDGKRYTLKISNEAEQEVVIDFQNRALLHVAEKDPSFPLPRVIPTLDGQLHCIVEDGGKTHFVRVLSWLGGRVLGHATTDAGLANRLGGLLARLSLALDGFDHPGSNPPSLWDMKRASGLRDLLIHIHEPGLRHTITQTLDRFDTKVKPILDTLRTQVIHGDMNPDNVLMDTVQAGRISGLIDFGDVVKSPLIVDLAIAAAYQLGDGEDPLGAALPMIAGFNAVQPLLDAEMDLLLDLVKTRLITSLLIMSYRAMLFPENREYLMGSYDSAKHNLFAFSQRNTEEDVARIRAVCV